MDKVSIYNEELHFIQQIDTAGSSSTESHPALQQTLENIVEDEETQDITSCNFEQTVSTVCGGKIPESTADWITGNDNIGKVL